MNRTPHSSGSSAEQCSCYGSQFGLGPGQNCVQPSSQGVASSCGNYLNQHGLQPVNASHGSLHAAHGSHMAPPVPVLACASCGTCFRAPPVHHQQSQNFAAMTAVQQHSNPIAYSPSGTSLQGYSPFHPPQMASPCVHTQGFSPQPHMRGAFVHAQQGPQAHSATAGFQRGAMSTPVPQPDFGTPAVS